MGIFNRWPYTNFHEMNLDWIIEEVKKAVTEVEALDLSFDELKKYVEDYFKNLDIDQKIDEAIQELIDSGQMEQIILDAFNELQEQLNVTNAKLDSVENSIMKPDISLFHPTYAKINIGAIKPVFACNNPSRGCRTYTTYSYTDGDEIVMGDLAADNITPINSFSFSVNHMNSIDYYSDGANGYLLIADVTKQIHIYNAITYGYVKSVNIESEYPIIAVTCIDSDIWIIEASSSSNPLKISKIDINGNILDSFNIDIKRFYSGNVAIHSYIQSCFNFYGDLCIICDSVNENGSVSGTSLITVDLFTKSLKSSIRLYNRGEIEDGYMIDDLIYLHGFASGQESTGCVIVMSKAPRNNISLDLHVDESAALNGNGESDSPFNNLASAIYNTTLFENMIAYISLDNDVVKPLYIPDTTSNKTTITLNGYNHTITINNIITLLNYNIHFRNVTITRTGNAYWAFDRNSNIIFTNCTFNKTNDTTFILGFWRSKVVIEGCAINLSTSGIYGICQVRYGTELICSQNTINSSTTNNRIVNGLGGVIINTTAIPSSTLTTPFAVNENTLLLTK